MAQHLATVSNPKDRKGGESIRKAVRSHTFRKYAAFPEIELAADEKRAALEGSHTASAGPKRYIRMRKGAK